MTHEHEKNRTRGCEHLGECSNIVKYLEPGKMGFRCLDCDEQVVFYVTLNLWKKFKGEDYGRSEKRQP
jgi:hypothetical protein